MLLVDEPIAIREWDEGDLPVLEASMGNAEMTRYLGGPESPEKLSARHARYLALAGTGTGHMFVILAGADRTPAGSVGYWDKEWRGEHVYEIGWAVLVSFQGRGIASRGHRAGARPCPGGGEASVRACVSIGGERGIQRDLPQARVRLPRDVRLRVSDGAPDAL